MIQSYQGQTNCAVSMTFLLEYFCTTHTCLFNGNDWLVTFLYTWVVHKYLIFFWRWVNNQVIFMWLSKVACLEHIVPKAQVDFVKFFTNFHIWMVFKDDRSNKTDHVKEPQKWLSTIFNGWGHFRPLLRRGKWLNIVIVFLSPLMMSSRSLSHHLMAWHPPMHHYCFWLCPWCGTIKSKASCHLLLTLQS